MRGALLDKKHHVNCISKSSERKALAGSVKLYFLVLVANQPLILLLLFFCHTHRGYGLKSIILIAVSSVKFNP